MPNSKLDNLATLASSRARMTTYKGLFLGNDEPLGEVWLKTEAVMALRARIDSHLYTLSQSSVGKMKVEV